MAPLIGCFAGCAGATTRMQVGDPLKVNRGICLVNTSYEQNGKHLNWDDTTRKLSRFKVSESHISAGNSWAIGSIVAAVAATPAIIVGDYGRRGDIDMNEDVATGLLVEGVIGDGVALGMRAVSDGE